MKPGVDYIGVGVGAFIMNDVGEFLLMKRGKNVSTEPGRWALPGGKIDFGETMREVVIRELKEELGVVVAITDQLPSYDYIVPEENQHWLTNIFQVRIISGIPSVQEEEKCSEIGWFTLNTLPSPIAKMSQQAIDNLL